MHFQIEYYNKLWKDWLAFDQKFYKTEEDARKRADEYKEHKLGIKTRIVQTTILSKTSKQALSKKTKTIIFKKI